VAGSELGRGCFLLTDAGVGVEDLSAIWLRFLPGVLETKLTERGDSGSEFPGEFEKIAVGLMPLL